MNARTSTLDHQLIVLRKTRVFGCSSRIIWRKSLPPWPFTMTSLCTPCPSSDETMSFNNESCVLGFTLIVSLMSSCVVLAPNGTVGSTTTPVSYTHLRAHETPEHLVCRLLLEK